MSVPAVPKEDNQFSTLWELKAPLARRDLIIKKVAISVIALLNFAALGVALYYIIAYCPVPNQALLISPFIVGVLAALANLKYPTFGVSSMNYSAYLNPTSLVGRAIAYLFFGPFQYAINKIDWTPYHDPIVANKISRHLEKKKFEEIAADYGKNFDNLTNYGFIHPNFLPELKELYKAHRAEKYELEFWKKEESEDCQEAQAAVKRKEKLEERWEAMKARFIHPFPHPKVAKLDFSSKLTKAKLKMRSFCCFGPPLNALGQLKA